MLTPLRNRSDSSLSIKKTNMSTSKSADGVHQERAEDVEVGSRREHSLPEPVDDVTCEYPEETSTMAALFQAFRGGLIAPSHTTYDSILILLTAPTKKERDRLTMQWRDHKLQELNFIGVVGALLAGCLTSTGSWPSILPNGKRSPWTVRACWYVGITFALFAVLTAAQQSIRLHRLSAHKDALANIRHYMGVRRRQKSSGELEIRPRRFQIYGWSASIIFLTLSVASMILGMCVLIWSSTQFGPTKKKGFENWWDDNARLAVTWSTITLATVFAFLMAQLSLAMRRDDR